jgi:hypothetical protein
MRRPIFMLGKGFAMSPYTKAIFTLSMAATLSLLVGGAASAAVSVSYIKPEEFRDVPFDNADRERILNDLSAHFVALGKKLPADQDLKIEVTDVDLAGREVPSRRTGNELRIVNGGADWPAMSLRYTLTSHGEVIATGDERLQDMDYQSHVNLYSPGENLRYEKQMIDTWFKKTFPQSVKS